MTSVNLDTNWYNDLGRVVNSSYIKLNVTISDHLAISFLSIRQVKMRITSPTYKKCIAALFLITQNCKLPKCLLEVKWIRKL